MSTRVIFVDSSSRKFLTLCKQTKKHGILRFMIDISLKVVNGWTLVYARNRWIESNISFHIAGYLSVLAKILKSTRAYTLNNIIQNNE